jgi:hypothetical protein
MRKGFVITILSVSLVVILLLLVMSLRNAQLATERALLEPLPLTYGAALLDNIAVEFNALVGPELQIGKANQSTIINIRDTIQTYNFSAEIAGYSSFLSSEVAGRSVSNITANFSNFTGGSISLYLNGNYTYTNNHKETQIAFTRKGGTGAKVYNASFAVTAIRNNVTHFNFNSSGNLNVTVTYADLNGTVVESGALFSNQSNTFRVTYVDGSVLTMTIGNLNGNEGSLQIGTTGIRSDFEFTTILPPMNPYEKLGYYYDARISYRQGPVSITRLIGK